MRTISMIFVVLVSLAFASRVLAFEPPSPTVQSAISMGQTAFLARVVCVRELKRFPMRTLARAKVHVLACYFGVCREGANLEIDFVSESIDDPETSVVMPISNLVLFVFPRKIEPGRISFRSGRNGYDLAFAAAMLPPAAQEESPLFFRNVYLPFLPDQEVEVEALHRWVEARKKQLKSTR